MPRFKLGERVIIKVGSRRIEYGIIVWMTPNETLFSIKLNDGRIIFALNSEKWCKHKGLTSHKVYKLEEA